MNSSMFAQLYTTGIEILHLSFGMTSALCCHSEAKPRNLDFDLAPIDCKP